MPLTKHGRDKYIKDKCRCETCCKAHTLYRRERKWAHLKKLTDNGSFTIDSQGRRINISTDCAHGTSSGYNYWWCRCRKCTDFNSKYQGSARMKQLSSHRASSR